MRAKLANINHCAVTFLSCAAVNFYQYYYTDICDVTHKFMKIPNLYKKKLHDNEHSICF